MPAPHYRYAIYWAPARGTPLDRFGTQWLGCDATTGRRATPPPVDGITRETIDGMTVEPRRYGFHGTLKSPFRLQHGVSEEDLFHAVDIFSRGQAAIQIESFSINTIGRFIAFSPDSGKPALSRLAAACVTELDHLRAPLTDNELARRRKRPLTRHQEDLLTHWGYPYVMEEFRFHLTLTDALTDDLRTGLAESLTRAAGPALGPACIDDIAVFAEPEPGAPFRLIRRFPLAGESTQKSGNCLSQRS
ncbi:MAG: DUF1045 domain-containing protein [Rhodospirillales bacterium]